MTKMMKRPRLANKKFRVLFRYFGDIQVAADHLGKQVPRARAALPTVEIFPRLKRHPRGWKLQVGVVSSRCDFCTALLYIK